MRRCFHVFSLVAGGLAFVLMQVGCAAKYTPQVSGKDAAYLVARPPVWLVSIDGRRASPVSSDKGKHYAVSPGEHRISVAFAGSGFRKVRSNYGPDRTVIVKIRGDSYVEVPFTAQSGHTYYLKSGQMGAVWRPHISESEGPVFMDPPP